MGNQAFGAQFGFMNHRALLCLLLLIGATLQARVVINEVCYDPLGADSGKEWIELYNAGTSDADLSGCKIFSCGISWSLAFEFPYFVLRPGRMVLVGGSSVANAQFTANFSFQNGGSASDAIRFVNADSSYTDTVIYDEPNSNLITDDTGMVAYSLAADAPEGSSLARVVDGWDSDLCALDFRVEPNPTPNAPNRVYTDYAVYDPILHQLGPGRVLSVGIRNRGVFPCPYIALFSAFEGEHLIHQEEIPALGASDSLRVEFILPPGIELVYLHLELENDIDPGNNLLYFSVLGGDPGKPVFNEVFPAPLPGKPEWIELYVESLSKGIEYAIRDAGGGLIRFSLPPVPGYFVVCANRDLFLSEYPSVNPALVVQSQGWTALNNTGDDLFLWEADELLDSLSYGNAPSGQSYARFQQESGASWSWVEPSPGKANDAHLQDLPQHAGRLQVFGSPCDPKKGEQITISFKLSSPSNIVNCRIYDLQGRLLSTLAENSPVPEAGILVWNGKTSTGRYASRGVCFILWESQSSAGDKIFRRQLTAVIR